MRTRPDPKPDCGNMPMTFGSLFARNPAGGVPALFRGRQVSYSFSTRVAIRKACDVLKLCPGDEILVPAYNCGSEIDPLRHAGLKVSFYPVDRQTLIDPDAVAARITPQTRAIYLIHYFGFLHPATAKIRSLCDKHGLVMIEDCALSLMSGVPLTAGQIGVNGRTGDVAVFCFYKFFPTLAGGALVINSPHSDSPAQFTSPAPTKALTRSLVRISLDATLGRPLISFLQSRFRRLKKAKPGGADVTEYPDMPQHYYFDPALENATISGFARRSLRSFDVMAAISARRANYQSYLDLLSNMPGITPLFPILPDHICPHSMPVLVANRDALAAGLNACGIAATPWWAGYNQHQAWDGFSDARYLKDHVLSLPLHQSLGAEAIRYSVDQLEKLVAQSG